MPRILDINKMVDKIRCQSCGMPLGIFQGKDNFGTNKDGSKSKEYCMFCFKNGNFTNPKMTLQDMIDSSVKFMVSDLKFTEEKAKELTNSVIPELKRWKN